MTASPDLINVATMLYYTEWILGSKFYGNFLFRICFPFKTRSFNSHMNFFCILNNELRNCLYGVTYWNWRADKKMRKYCIRKFFISINSDTTLREEFSILFPSRLFKYSRIFFFSRAQQRSEFYYYIPLHLMLN